MFIHRNTLVYRLDKLQKSTGLDLRVFEDAITKSHREVSLRNQSSAD